MDDFYGLKPSREQVVRWICQEVLDPRSVSPFVVEDLHQLIARFGPDGPAMVREIGKEALQAKARSLDYIVAVAHAWLDHGVTYLAALEAYRRRRRRSVESVRRHRQPPIHPSSLAAPPSVQP